MPAKHIGHVGLHLATLPGVGSYVWSVPTGVVEWSPELVTLYGLDRAPTTEDGFLACVHPDDRLRVEAETTGFLAAGDSYQHEFRIVRPGGDVRVIHDRGVIERAENGAALRMRGVNIEVTEVRQQVDPELVDLAVDAANQGSWDYDIRTDAPSWDLRTYRLFGLPPGEPLSFDRVVGDVIHPEDREAVRSAFREATDPTGSGRYAVEHRVTGANDELRWLSVTGRTLFEGTGTKRQAVRMMGLVRDVTEQRRAADALRESQELLKMALSAGEMGVWSSFPAEGMSDCDETVCRHMGLEPGRRRYASDEVERQIHPDDRDGVLAAWEALKPGETLRTEFRVLDETDGERWLMGAGQWRVGGRGETIAVGLTWDVTDQKRREARLRESEALFRTVADNLPHMVWLHDADGSQVFVNQTFCDYFRVSREEMRDDRWQVFLHPEDAGPYSAEFEACVRDRRPFHAEVRVQNHSGEWRWIESWARPWFGTDGQYLGQIGASADITDRKREVELRRLLLEELEHRVKNTFALVQSVARHTLRGERPVAELRDALTGRLQALAAANDILTREQWERAELRTVVLDALRSCGADQARVSTEGPEVDLQPRQAISLALALHELCTNAVKYGSLSNDRGRVSVRWTRSQRASPLVTFVWSEEDGPLVEPPASRGFGSLLIEQALAAELSAEVTMDFRPEGLRCTVAAELG